MMWISKEVDRLIVRQYEKVDGANSEIVDIWIEHILFSPGWWVVLLLALAPWIIWIKYRKKESTARLLLAGIWVALIANFLNYIGVTLGLWQYKVKLVPVIPDFIAWDFSILPVTIMFLIQIRPNVKPIVKALLFSTFTAFVGEPFFNWLDFFDYKNWHYLASFPFYVVIYLVANRLTTSKSFSPIRG
ncbi:CBO0543 family protein [Ammoniphilus sp. YIM 78166]|uniref:CBO0543 family protein n=1 Tax=Ammoniphilus sp. YIM 78166 TaxID=1644106 RepID=UPI0010705151|nr:CBO0543 family protein [Ammoniphilus sp. YIM 78166]